MMDILIAIGIALILGQVVIAGLLLLLSNMARTAELERRKPGGEV